MEAWFDGFQKRASAWKRAHCSCSTNFPWRGTSIVGLSDIVCFVLWFLFFFFKYIELFGFFNSSAIISSFYVYIIVLWSNMKTTFSSVESHSK